MCEAKEKTPKLQVFDTLRPRLSADGFKLVMGKTRFVRKHPNGFTDVFLLASPSLKPSGWRMHPVVGIRVDAIEDIFHKVSGMLPKYQKDTTTIGAGVGDILFGSNKKYEFALVNNADVGPVADAMEKAFRDFALEQFFKQYDTLTAIDALLNSDPEGLRKAEHSLASSRFMPGAIVAKLVNRPNYDELVRAYAKRIVTNGPLVRKFDALLEVLDSTSPLLS